MKSKANLKSFWDKRFGNSEFVYGSEPNVFFKNELDALAPGKILLPAEGEGRNAVYAAGQGWEVDAFDLSKAGQKKAMKLAQKHSVTVHYQIADFESIAIAPRSYDVLALIYAHIPTSARRSIHRKLARGLKPGGKLILEAFSKKQLDNSSGGPKAEKMLYRLDELKKDFENFEFSIASQGDHHINEGEHTRGWQISSVWPA